jgi:hypothetical protein
MMRVIAASAMAGIVTISGCGGSSRGPTAPAAPALPTSTDPKDLSEALLLGSGPLANPANVVQTMVYGWESGSEIKVRVSTQLPGDSLALVQQFVSRVSEATLGHVRATIEPTTDVDPRPAVGEITVWATANPQSAGCPGGASLCSLGLATKLPYLHGSRIVGVPNGNFAHELGHAIFGFNHCWNPNVFAKETVMAGGWALTDRDVAMMQSLYAAGLGPGATRADLVAAGIVNP